MTAAEASEIRKGILELNNHVHRLAGERDAARSYLAKVTAERDAAIRELGDTAQKMGRIQASLDAERTARKAGQRVLEKVQSWMLEPDRSRAQSFTSVEVGAALALAAKLP